METILVEADPDVHQAKARRIAVDIAKLPGLATKPKAVLASVGEIRTSADIDPGLAWW